MIVKIEEEKSSSQLIMRSTSPYIWATIQSVGDEVERAADLVEGKRVYISSNVGVPILDKERFLLLTEDQIIGIE